MSTIKADTLSNLAGTQSVPVTTVAQGSAKCWVNFNGTGTVAIRASFNVSSITDNSVGDYTVNFATAMEDADYAAAGLCAIVSAGNPQHITLGTTSIQTTSAFQFQTISGTTNSANTFDSGRVFVAIFR